jgi:AcrR family transcriptional regulator
MSAIGKRRAAAAASAADSSAYQERRRTIQEAAGRVFHRKGLAATTLTDVAEEAGMDRASLYYYVGSKDQLFREIVSEAAQANVDEAERIVATDESAREKLTLLVTSLMRSFEQHYPYLYVLVREDFGKPARMANADDDWRAQLSEWNERYFAAVKSVVSQGMRSGEIASSLPPGIVANTVIGMVDSTHLWFQPNGIMDAAEIGAGMAEMILDGLATRGRGSRP